jgi:hypothetical protein
MTWTMKWRKYENPFLISAEKYSSRKRITETKRAKGYGRLASVEHNKFLFKTMNPVIPSSRSRCAHSPANTRWTEEEKGKNDTEKTRTPSFQYPMQLNRYTEEGQRHAMNTNTQYERKLLQRFKRKEEVGKRTAEAIAVGPLPHIRLF